MMGHLSTVLVLSIFLCFSSTTFSQSRKPIQAKRYELLSGIRTSKDDKTFWDRKYSKDQYIYGKNAAKFLRENFHYIPAGSKVLDMGMGEGRNAVFLARKGYKVTGIDLSSVAVKKARRLAREFDVRINTVVADLGKYKISDGAFDAIICFYVVDRSLHEKMMRWLRPGGVLIYEAFTDDQRKIPGSERMDKRYLLRPGELLKMFPTARTLKYEEPLHLKKYRASIIVQKKEK